MNRYQKMCYKQAIKECKTLWNDELPNDVVQSFYKTEMVTNKLMTLERLREFCNQVNKVSQKVKYMF